MPPLLKVAPANTWGAGVLGKAPIWRMRQLRPHDSPAACRDLPRTTLPVDTASPTFFSSPASCKDARPAWRSVDSPYLLLLPSPHFFFCKHSPAPSDPQIGPSSSPILASWTFLQMNTHMLLPPICFSHQYAYPKPS